LIYTIQLLIGKRVGVHYKIIELGPLPNPTQLNMTVFMAEQINVIFNNKVIDEIAMK